MGVFDRISRPLSPDGFAERLIVDLAKAGDPRLAEYDSTGFLIRFRTEGRETGYASLRNLYDEYLTHAGRDRDQFFRTAVRSMLASHKAVPDDYEDARADILVSVRNRSYFSFFELQGQADNGNYQWPYQAIGEHLGVGIVYDLPEAMVMLQSVHLEDWGVSFYELLEDGLSNLGELAATFTTIDDHSYVSTTGDHYDISRILLPDLIQELEINGDPIILAPNRDRLLLTGSEDRRGIETVALVAERLLSHPRPMTGMAFRLCENEWQPWLPNQEHAAYAKLKTIAQRTAQTDYRDQCELLRNDLARRGSRLDVADYRVHGAGVKQPTISYSIWREGRDTLLPKTDRVCLLRHDEQTDHPLVESINVSWDDFYHVAGELLSDTDYYPSRTRTNDFPNSRQLAQLSRL